MLSWAQVLNYVKENLALPSTFIEDNDTKLREWIELTALKEFSQYIPDWERCAVIVDSTDYRHETRSDNYYFFDEEDCDIISIRQCYFSSGDMAFNAGHPMMGPLSFEGMKWWSLGVFKSRFFFPFSMWSYTYHFIPPNIVEVTPSPGSDNFVVEYERTQPKDLSKIPAAMDMTFMDLALAHVMVKLGRLRMHYGGEVATPFGTIPLNGEQLKTDGETLRKEMVEVLVNESLPTVVIDVY